MRVDVQIKGKAAKVDSNTVKQFMQELYKELAESAQRAIIEEFERSTEINAMVGEASDPEAVRAIIRGIKVDVECGAEASLVAKFDDPYGHWYGNEDIPQEFQDKLQSLLEQAMTNWSNTSKIHDIVVDAMNDESQ